MNDTQAQQAPVPAVVVQRAPVPEVLPREDYSLAALAHGLTAKLQVCELLLNSKLLPKQFETKESVFAAITMGHELGFSPMASVRFIYVTNGKPSIDSAGIKALCIKHGGRFYTLEESDTKVVVRATRGDQEETVSFTMEQAQKAGLSGKENWQKYPRDCLYAKCITRLGRRLFADVIGGIPAAEEILDGEYVDEAELKERRVEQAASDVKKIQAEAGRRFVYDTMIIVDETERAKAVRYLQDCGATPAEAEGVFYSGQELKKARNIQVTTGQGASSNG